MLLWLMFISCNWLVRHSWCATHLTFNIYFLFAQESRFIPAHDFARFLHRANEDQFASCVRYNYLKQFLRNDHYFDEKYYVFRSLKFVSAVINVSIPFMISNTNCSNTKLLNLLVWLHSILEQFTINSLAAGLQYMRTSISA